MYPSQAVQAEAIQRGVEAAKLDAARPPQADIASLPGAITKVVNGERRIYFAPPGMDPEQQKKNLDAVNEMMAPSRRIDIEQSLERSARTPTVTLQRRGQIETIPVDSEQWLQRKGECHLVGAPVSIHAPASGKYVTYECGQGHENGCWAYNDQDVERAIAAASDMQLCGTCARGARLVAKLVDIAGPGDDDDEYDDDFDIFYE